MSASLLRFGRFELDPANFQIRRSRRPLRLERIPLEVLLLLVERRGRLVLRQEIANRIWGPEVVLDIDNALNTAIRKVRRALSDDPEHPRYVETVPAKGYRFIGTVTAVAGVPDSARGEEGGCVDSPPSLREGERKQVTVLFADLKGAMELLADRDPEDARNVLDPILEGMLEAVQRYEGTVTQVTGDGIMALFGAPLAHEDHAVRACYAALGMQESVRRHIEDLRRPVGAPIHVRIGLNSGEVVVRAIGPDQQMNYTAFGRTAQLAAGLGQLADPGSVLITAATLRLAEGYVHARPLGPVVVKGLSETVDAHEVSGRAAIRSRLQAAAARGLSPLVGRDTELAQLYRALDQARQGRGQVAAVVGDAGVGKSRLLYQLTHSRHVHGWLILEGGSVSYGKSTSYLPVIDLLKGYFKIRDGDDLRRVREKVMSKLASLDEASTQTPSALLALFDVPVDDASWQRLDPGQRRQCTLDAVKRLLIRQAREQPLLLIFEDLHWIDGETQAALDTLVDGLGSARLRLVVSYRSGYQHVWGSKTYYGQIRLDALAAANAAALLKALLGDDPSLAPLKQLLVKRGNPFFLEEACQALVETKALVGERGAYRLTQSLHAIEVPPTVQAILAARIDRLGPDDKRLLQVASVVGKDIPLALLQAIAGLPEEALRRGLDHLQAAEFLYETGLYPDVAYAFKHALTHEVTYGGLLHERRHELHARIVEAIETLHGDRLGEQIERLAHHALRGDLREKAVDYLRQAGGKAVARSAPQEARGWFEQALSVLAALPESQSALEQAFEIRLELRPVLHQLGEPRQTLERLREAEVLAARLNDERRRGRVYAFMTIVHSLLGDLDEALVTGGRALEIAGRFEDLRLRILATIYLELAHHSRGEYERVVELATGNLVALPADWVYECFGNVLPPSVWDRHFLVMGLAALGRFAEAAEHEAEALRLAEPTQHAYTIGMALFAAGTLHLLKGDWEKARSLIEHEIAVTRTGNVVLLLAWAVASSAWILAQFAETSEALNRLREGEQLLENQAANGIAAHHGWGYQSLGRACLLLGRLDEARRLGHRAVESSLRQPGFAAHALHLLGDIETHPDCFDAAKGEAHYRQALTLAEPRGMRPVVAHCHLGLGKLYRRAGKRHQAREHLAIATTMYREIEMCFWLEQAEAEKRLGD